MRTNTQEVLVSAYIVSIGKRTPRDAAQDATELCRFASSLNRLNEIACNYGLSERQVRRKQNLRTRIKTVVELAGLVLNHFNNDPRGYAVYLDLPDGSYNSFGWRSHVLVAVDIIGHREENLPRVKASAIVIGIEGYRRPRNRELESRGCEASVRASPVSRNTADSCHRQQTVIRLHPTHSGVPELPW